MNIAVWCGARPGIDPAFIESACAAGTWLGENGHTLVYGGGKLGLMGAVAECCKAAGGSVIGINVEIDDFLAQLYEGSTRSYIAPTLYQRKANMVALADAYLCLPGGIGTLDELSEVLALERAGIERKRIAVYNVNHFYDPLLLQFSAFVSSEFASKDNIGNILISDDFEKIAKHLLGGAPVTQKRRRIPTADKANPACVPAKMTATLQRLGIVEASGNYGSGKAGGLGSGGYRSAADAVGTCANAPEGAIMLMVSGGSDSTALAYAASALHANDGPLASYTIAMMHLNHKLRGEEADVDARFVEQLAQNLGFPCYVYETDIAKISNDEHGNIEAIGRRERYEAAEEALADFCAETGAPFDNSYIFTAHTQNDRVENFYMRSIVGTGPGGFRSMDYQRDQIVHPLLDCSRDELRAYINELAHCADQAARGTDEDSSAADEGASEAKCAIPTIVRSESGVLWRNDPTNAKTDRFRTYVRNEVIPHITALNPRMLNTLCRSMNLIADEDDYLEEQATQLARSTVEWINPHAADVLTENWGGILPDMHVEVITEGREPEPDYSAGCVLSPRFGEAHVVLQRRVVFRVLQLMIGPDARVETASVDAVLDALGRSGHVTNIQGNLAVSTNKRGTRIEPMDAFRARRKRL